MENKTKLNVGSSVIVTGYIGLSLVSFIIVKGADLNTAEGRHLLAGALANAAFCFSQIMITYFALRKGKRWAWWSNLIPAFGYGLTMLIIDAAHVHKTRLFTTLAPQVAGLIILGTGLIISWTGLDKLKNA
jgi:hypothetical protein